MRFGKLQCLRTGSALLLAAAVGFLPSSARADDLLPQVPVLRQAPDIAAVVNVIQYNPGTKHLQMTGRPFDSTIDGALNGIYGDYKLSVNIENDGQLALDQSGATGLAISDQDRGLLLSGNVSEFGIFGSDEFRFVFDVTGGLQQNLFTPKIGVRVFANGVSTDFSNLISTMSFVGFHSDNFALVPEPSGVVSLLAAGMTGSLFGFTYWRRKRKQASIIACQDGSC